MGGVIKLAGMLSPYSFFNMSSRFFTKYLISLSYSMTERGRESMRKPKTVRTSSGIPFVNKEQKVNKNVNKQLT